MNCFLRHLKYRTVLLAIAVLAVVGMCAEGSVKRLEIRPPSDGSWFKAAPMISFDGTPENSAQLTQVDEHCGWFYYEWGPDEKVPDSVAFFKPDDVEMKEAAGSDGWPLPYVGLRLISLASAFERVDSLYIELDDGKVGRLYENLPPYLDGIDRCIGDTVPVRFWPDTLDGTGYYFSLRDENENIVFEDGFSDIGGKIYFCGIVVRRAFCDICLYGEWDFIVNADSICGLKPGTYLVSLFTAMKGDEYRASETFTVSNESKAALFKTSRRSPVSIIPKNGSIQISSESAKQPYSIMDSQGRVLRRGTLNQLIEIPVPSSGCYIVKVGNVVRNLRVR